MEFGGVVVGFCFGGRRGPVSFRAVKGKGGQSALESQLPGAVEGEAGPVSFGGGVVAVCFCFGGRRGPVSFRAVKGKGGQSALELCSSSVFVLRQAGGPVSFRGCEGGMF